MKKFILSLVFTIASIGSIGQSTWQVCVEDPPSTTCVGKTGTFTPGNLVIQQGDMIQFTTKMVLLSGYSGTFHDIQFAGSAPNNVTLLVSSDIFNQTTTVTTPPFNTAGVFPMECVNFNHCILAEYSCTGYSVTVQSSCAVTASFTSSATTVCAGDIVNFTNTSSGASIYDWNLDETPYATTTNSSQTFATAGSYDIELIADDGSGCLDSTTITIDVDPTSIAGADSVQSFCNINDSIDLNTLVTGNFGGVWEETISSSGQFNTSTGVLDYSGLSQQGYFFDYIINGVGVCPNDTAEITITVLQEPSLNLSLGVSPIATSDSLGVDFSPSGVLPGAIYLWSFCDGNTGSSSSPFFYSWAAAGNYCVCVTVSNLNGCSESYCDSTVSVFDDSGISGNELQLEQLKIYPNPASSLINVDLTSYTGKYQLVITDLKGNEVLRKQFNGGAIISIDIDKYSKGYYNIRIENPDSMAKTSFAIE
jgi:PKD repeat protein